MSQPTGTTNIELGPPGLGDSAAGHAEAMERRRRRLWQAAGFDPGRKKQSELFDIPLPPRADLWVIEWRPRRDRTASWRSDITWFGSDQSNLQCATMAIVKHVLAVLRTEHKDRCFRSRPIRWAGQAESKFPTAS